MLDQLTLYLFGDQTFDIQPRLKDLLRHRSNPVVEDFLVKAYEVVRTEIYELAPPVRDDLPRFTCLDDLVLWKHDGRRCVPLDMAVTCMYQLGIFIRYGSRRNGCGAAVAEQFTVKPVQDIRPQIMPAFLGCVQERWPRPASVAAAARLIWFPWPSKQSVSHSGPACV